MALKITRQADANKLLLPEGWKWSDGISGPTVKDIPRLTSESATDEWGNFIAPNRPAWAWGSLVLTPSRPTVAQQIKGYKNLIAMLLKYEVEFKVASWSAGGVRVPRIIQVKPMTEEFKRTFVIQRGCSPATALETYRRDQADNNLNMFGWDANGRQVKSGEITLDGNILFCANCQRVYANLVINPENGSWYCRRCLRVCPGTGDEQCNIPVFDENYHGCEVHFPRADCPGCNKRFEATYMVEHRGKNYCVYCHRSICQRCNKVGAVDAGTRAVQDGRESYLVCKDCIPYVVTWLGQQRNEIIVPEKACSMFLESNPKRPVRLASVELEISSGAPVILADLYGMGFANNSQIQGYHSGDDTSFCYMERDGSLGPDGGELIFSKMRMDSADTVKRLSEAIGVVRRNVKRGNAGIDLNAGCHVHIDAHKMGYNHIRNLVLLFNYLEDPIYRISAANYTRHRGTNYAMMLPKQNLDSQGEFNRHFFRNNSHHSVLNVAYFYSAVGNRCRCGNITNGNPDLCECQLGKCTVEFRVFNGTSSWKKLHAYLALCMSMVAYARSVDDLDIDDFVPCLYTPVGMIDAELKRGWTSRLEWMFENLWFSEEERESLHYCIEHSELNVLSSVELRRLRGIQYKGKKYLRRKPAKTSAPTVSDERKFITQAQWALRHGIITTTQ